ncbi:YeeE/YedE family protein [Tabrizicola sp. BL-A-41-H6]|uniref:YeeE/YedE family protein n=1 Tax=Tabrizicola sp. BL-A-41-H6 TaxID=3421107 RepID=UPI003D678706
METDWIWGFAGGALIGTAGAIFLLMNGRVMGASGLVGGIVDGTDRWMWRETLAFLFGLIVAPALLRPVFTTQTHLTDSLPVILLAGLMVGFGSRLANGCTSGHGVCGISRLSLRGIVATVIYIGAGGVVMALLRHLWGVI